jgi:hypothetical protein
MIPPRGKVELRRGWKKNMRNRRRRQEGQQEYRGDREQRRVRCLRKRRDEGRPHRNGTAKTWKVQEHTRE